MPFTKKSIWRLSGIAHDGGMGSSNHLCSEVCLNIPTQMYANVCGVAVAVLGAISCTAPDLWRNVFLTRNMDLPTSLKWLLSPSTYSDFLKCTIISWLFIDCIDVASIGINREAIPTPREDIAPSRCRRVADTVIISDDECTNEDKMGRRQLMHTGNQSLKTRRMRGRVKNLQLSGNPQSVRFCLLKERAVKKIKTRRIRPGTRKNLEQMQAKRFEVEEERILKEHRCLLAMTRKSRIVGKRTERKLTSKLEIVK